MDYSRRTRVPLPPDRGQRMCILRQERLKAVLSQKCVDFMDVVESVVDRCQQSGIPGKARVEWGHAVQDQRLLHFLCRESRRKAEPQDRVTPPGVFFFADKPVAVTLRQIGGEKNVLLQEPFLADLLPHVIRERMRTCDELRPAQREEAGQLFQLDMLQFVPQQRACLLIAVMMQFVHPFHSERRSGQARPAFCYRRCKFYELRGIKSIYPLEIETALRARQICFSSGMEKV